tara:strand:+ start:1074 stop:2033 length:960 start_codon:yes stop_codon:yes gene_type:complete
MKIDVTELDIFYISYDEPNCEENWADLLNKVPWAKRVHGVKGFDAAHKACAEQSETDRFITVDGDNIVMDEFFNQQLEFPEKDHDGNDISESIFSWNAKNLLNGLVYGNGGLKCWPKEYTLGINTHEAATDGEGMEFCWKLNYIQMNDIFSEVHQTASPFQAFRAGFREGVKLSLDQGARVKANNFKDKIWYGNFNRLNVWCNIGTDVENGWWALYGSRLGCEKTVLSDWNTNQISDYDWFKEFFEKERSSIDDQDHLQSKTIAIGDRLNDEIQGMMLFDPNDQMSKFFKATFVNPKRWGAMVTERQIQDLLEKGLIGQ